MSRERCAFVHPHPWMGMSRGGRCGRFPAAGETLCSVHDPEHKAATKAAHEARKARALRGTPLSAALHREALIREIAELSVWWDGPGSEGRCV